jgi:mannose-6-phosphate isomerase-like protein (cupin superfamily)
MSVINREELPFVDMSHEFVGEKHGVNISFFLVNAPPGRGPELHRHNYDEVIVVQEGQATCVAGNEQREVKAGDIVVIPAGTPHRFVNSGNAPLRQIDIPRQLQIRDRMARSGSGGSTTSASVPDRRSGKRNRLHLDLYTIDQEGEVERLIKLAARWYPWKYQPR